MRNAMRAPMGVGIPTVLTILVTLILCSFSAMSLLSANADARLTNKATVAVAAYYDADSQAERKVSRIGEALRGGDGWQLRVQALDVQVDIQSDRATFDFVIRQESQSLWVTLEQPLKNGMPYGSMLRTRWQLVSGEPR